MERRELAELLKRTQRDNSENPNVIAAWKHQQGECATEHKDLLIRIAETQKEVKTVWKELT